MSRFKAKWKWILMVCVLACAPAFAQPLDPWLEIEGRLGSDETDGATGSLWLPLMDSNGHMLFLDVRGGYGEDNDNFETSVGLGYRMLLTDHFILGFYGYIDRYKSASDTKHDQYMFGVEALTENWEMRINAYFPDDQAHPLMPVEIYPETGRYVFDDGDFGVEVDALVLYERGMNGYDAEIGYTFRARDYNMEGLENFELRVIGGYFHFEGDNVEDISGPKARAELLWHDPLGFDGWEAVIGIDARDDDVRGSEVAAVFRVKIPLGGVMGDSYLPRPGSIRHRMNTQVRRERGVQTQQFIDDGTWVGDVYNPYADMFIETALFYSDVPNGTGDGTYEDPMSLEDAIMEGEEGALLIGIDREANGDIFTNSNFAALQYGQILANGGTTILGPEFEVYIEEFAPFAVPETYLTPDGLANLGPELHHQLVITDDDLIDQESDVLMFVDSNNYINGITFDGEGNAAALLFAESSENLYVDNSIFRNFISTDDTPAVGVAIASDEEFLDEETELPFDLEVLPPSYGEFIFREVTFEDYDGTGIVMIGGANGSIRVEDSTFQEAIGSGIGGDVAGIYIEGVDSLTDTSLVVIDSQFLNIDGGGIGVVGPFYDVELVVYDTEFINDSFIDNSYGIYTEITDYNQVMFYLEDPDATLGDAELLIDPSYTFQNLDYDMIILASLGAQFDLMLNHYATSDSNNSLFSYIESTDDVNIEINEALSDGTGNVIDVYGFDLIDYDIMLFDSEFNDFDLGFGFYGESVTNMTAYVTGTSFFDVRSGGFGIDGGMAVVTNGMIVIDGEDIDPVTFMNTVQEGAAARLTADNVVDLDISVDNVLVDNLTDGISVEIQNSEMDAAHAVSIYESEFNNIVNNAIDVLANDVDDLVPANSTTLFVGINDNDFNTVGQAVEENITGYDIVDLDIDPNHVDTTTDNAFEINVTDVGQLTLDIVGTALEPATIMNAGADGIQVNLDNVDLFMVTIEYYEIGSDELIDDILVETMGAGDDGIEINVVDSTLDDDWAGQINIDNVHIYNVGGDGIDIYLEETTVLPILNIGTEVSVNDAGERGVAIEATDVDLFALTLTDLDIDGTGLEGIFVGVNATDGQSYTAVIDIFANNLTGIGTDAVSVLGTSGDGLGTTVMLVDIYDHELEDVGGSGIVVDMSGDTLDAEIYSNIIDGTGENGIYVGSTDGLTDAAFIQIGGFAIGNTLSDIGANGILVNLDDFTINDGDVGIVIDENVVDGFGALVPDSYGVGVQIDGDGYDTETVYIINNTILGGVGSAIGADFTEDNDLDDTTAYILVDNNTIGVQELGDPEIDIVGNGILINADAYSFTSVVTNNTIWEVSGNGIDINTADQGDDSLYVFVGGDGVGNFINIAGDSGITIDVDDLTVTNDAFFAIVVDENIINQFGNDETDMGIGVEVEGTSFNADAIVITENLINNEGSDDFASTGTGILVDIVDSDNNSSSVVQITDNYLGDDTPDDTDIAGDAIVVGSSTTSFTADVSDNFISDASGSGVLVNGFMQDELLAVQVLNNQIDSVGGSGVLVSLDQLTIDDAADFGVLIDNNLITSFGTAEADSVGVGVAITDSQNYAAETILISNNVIENGTGDAISVTAMNSTGTNSLATQINNNFVGEDDGEIDITAGNGILVDTDTDMIAVTIVENEIFDVAETGIEVTNISATDIDIVIGVTDMGNEINSAGLYGILVDLSDIENPDDATFEVVIGDNIVGDFGSAAASAGIQVDVDGEQFIADEVTIYENLIETGTGDGIVVNFVENSLDPDSTGVSIVNIIDNEIGLSGDDIDLTGSGIIITADTNTLTALVQDNEIFQVGGDGILINGVDQGDGSLTVDVINNIVGSAGQNGILIDIDDLDTTVPESFHVWVYDNYVQDFGTTTEHVGIGLTIDGGQYIATDIAIFDNQVDEGTGHGYYVTAYETDILDSEFAAMIFGNYAGTEFTQVDLDGIHIEVGTDKIGDEGDGTMLGVYDNTIVTSGDDGINIYGVGQSEVHIFVGDGDDVDSVGNLIRVAGDSGIEVNLEQFDNGGDASLFDVIITENEIRQFGDSADDMGIGFSLTDSTEFFIDETSPLIIAGNVMATGVNDTSIGDGIVVYVEEDNLAEDADPNTFSVAVFLNTIGDDTVDEFNTDLVDLTGTAIDITSNTSNYYVDVFSNLIESVGGDGIHVVGVDQGQEGDTEGTLDVLIEGNAITSTGASGIQVDISSLEINDYDFFTVDVLGNTIGSFGTGEANADGIGVFISGGFEDIFAADPNIIGNTILSGVGDAIHASIAGDEDEYGNGNTAITTIDSNVIGDFLYFGQTIIGNAIVSEATYLDQMDHIITFNSVEGYTGDGIQINDAFVLDDNFDIHDNFLANGTNGVVFNLVDVPDAYIELYNMELWYMSNNGIDIDYDVNNPNMNSSLVVDIYDSEFNAVLGTGIVIQGTNLEIGFTETIDIDIDNVYMGEFLAMGNGIALGDTEGVNDFDLFDATITNSFLYNGSGDGITSNLTGAASTGIILIDNVEIGEGDIGTDWGGDGINLDSSTGTFDTDITNITIYEVGGSGIIVNPLNTIDLDIFINEVTINDAGENGVLVDIDDVFDTIDPDTLTITNVDVNEFGSSDEHIGIGINAEGDGLIVNGFTLSDNTVNSGVGDAYNLTFNSTGAGGGYAIIDLANNDTGLEAGTTADITGDGLVVEVYNLGEVDIDITDWTIYDTSEDGIEVVADNIGLLALDITEDGGEVIVDSGNPALNQAGTGSGAAINVDLNNVDVAGILVDADTLNDTDVIDLIGYADGVNIDVDSTGASTTEIVLADLNIDDLTDAGIEITGTASGSGAVTDSIVIDIDDIDIGLTQGTNSGIVIGNDVEGLTNFNTADITINDVNIQDVVNDDNNTGDGISMNLVETGADTTATVEIADVIIGTDGGAFADFGGNGVVIDSSTDFFDLSLVNVDIAEVDGNGVEVNGTDQTGLFTVDMDTVTIEDAGASGILVSTVGLNTSADIDIEESYIGSFGDDEALAVGIGIDLNGTLYDADVAILETQVASGFGNGIQVVATADNANSDMTVFFEGVDVGNGADFDTDIVGNGIVIDVSNMDQVSFDFDDVEVWDVTADGLNLTSLDVDELTFDWELGSIDSFNPATGTGIVMDVDQSRLTNIDINGVDIHNFVDGVDMTLAHEDLNSTTNITLDEMYIELVEVDPGTGISIVAVNNDTQQFDDDLNELPNNVETLNINIGNNTDDDVVIEDGVIDGIVISATDYGTTNITVDGGEMQGGDNDAINIEVIETGNPIISNVTVSNVTIGEDNAELDWGGEGIEIVSDTNTFNVDVTDNDIWEVGGTGILINGVDQGEATLNVLVSGNEILATGADGIMVDIDGLQTELPGDFSMEISDNDIDTFGTAGAASGITVDIEGTAYNADLIEITGNTVLHGTGDGFVVNVTSTQPGDVEDPNYENYQGIANVLFENNSAGDPLDGDTEADITGSGFVFTATDMDVFDVTVNFSDTGDTAGDAVVFEATDVATADFFFGNLSSVNTGDYATDATGVAITLSNVEDADVYVGDFSTIDGYETGLTLDADDVVDGDYTFTLLGIENSSGDGMQIDIDNGDLEVDTNTLITIEDSYVDDVGDNAIVINGTDSDADNDNDLSIQITDLAVGMVGEDGLVINVTDWDDLDIDILSDGLGTTFEGSTDLQGNAIVIDATDTEGDNVANINISGITIGDDDADEDWAGEGIIVTTDYSDLTLAADGNELYDIGNDAIEFNVDGSLEAEISVSDNTFNGIEESAIEVNVANVEVGTLDVDLNVIGTVGADSASAIDISLDTVGTDDVDFEFSVQENTITDSANVDYDINVAVVDGYIDGTIDSNISDEGIGVDISSTNDYDTETTLSVSNNTIEEDVDGTAIDISIAGDADGSATNALEGLTLINNQIGVGDDDGTPDVENGIVIEISDIDGSEGDTISVTGNTVYEAEFTALEITLTDYEEFDLDISDLNGDDTLESLTDDAVRISFNDAQGDLNIDGYAGGAVNLEDGLYVGEGIVGAVDGIALISNSGNDQVIVEIDGATIEGDIGINADVDETDDGITELDILYSNSTITGNGGTAIEADTVNEGVELNSGGGNTVNGAIIIGD